MRLWILKIVALLCIGFSLAVGAAVLTPVKAEVGEAQAVWTEASSPDKEIYKDDSLENWGILCFSKDEKFSHCQMETVFNGSKTLGDFIWVLSFDHEADFRMILVGIDNKKWTSKLVDGQKYDVLYTWPQPIGWFKFGMYGNIAGNIAGVHAWFKPEDMKDYLKALITKPEMEIKIGNAPAINLNFVEFAPAFKKMMLKAREYIKEMK